MESALAVSQLLEDTSELTHTAGQICRGQGDTPRSPRLQQHHNSSSAPSKDSPSLTREGQEATSLHAQVAPARLCWHC